MALLELAQLLISELSRPPDIAASERAEIICIAFRVASSTSAPLPSEGGRVGILGRITPPCAKRKKGERGFEYGSRVRGSGVLQSIKMVSAGPLRLLCTPERAEARRLFIIPSRTPVLRRRAAVALPTMRGRAQCGLLLLAALGAAGLVEDPAPSPDDATVHSGGTAAARTGTRARDADHADQHVGGCPTLSGGRGGRLAVRDVLCQDECHCSSAYYDNQIIRAHRELTAENVLREPLTCTTRAACAQTLAQAITVVVGVYSRPEYFERVTSAILRSTANVTRLWIVCNGSPHLELFRTKSAELSASSPGVRVDFFGSTLEVGYFERFLRVMVVETPYVAFIDDDIVIGPDFLALCVRALNTRAFRGILGWGGRTLRAPSSSSDSTYLRPDWTAQSRPGLGPCQERLGGDGEEGAQHRDRHDGIFGREHAFVMPHPGDDMLVACSDPERWHECSDFRQLQAAARGAGTAGQGHGGGTSQEIDVLFGLYFGERDMMQVLVCVW